jgi:hypothetical protein
VRDRSLHRSQDSRLASSRDVAGTETKTDGSGGGATAAAGGERVAGAALPDLDLDPLPTEHLDELHVGPVGKQGVCLENAQTVAALLRFGPVGVEYAYSESPVRSSDPQEDAVGAHAEVTVADPANDICRETPVFGVSAFNNQVVITEGLVPVESPQVAFRPANASRMTRERSESGSSLVRRDPHVSPPRPRG